MQAREKNNFAGALFLSGFATKLGTKQIQQSSFSLCKNNM